MPWCVRKCPYCDFNSHAVRGAVQDTAALIPERAYVDALLTDLDGELARAGTDRPLVSIFIGGGTPSLFSGAAIRRLLAGVRARVQLAADAEITLETNPGTVDAAHFAGYAEAGVNRLSIGVQSLNDDALARLGRIHSAADARRAVQAARDAGIGNLNLDMMFALPGQELPAARQDLEQLIALEPEHISYYELTLEPNTAFYQRPPELPDPDLADAIQQQGLALLEASGFERYEVSAFAKPGRRCRHNLNYWRFGDYLGIGAGAHGKLTDPSSGMVERRAKLRHPDAYLAACEMAGSSGRYASSGLAPDPSRSKQPVLAFSETGRSHAYEARCTRASADLTSSLRRLTNQDLVEEFALNAFRLLDGFSRGEFEGATGLRADRLEPGLEAAAQLGLVIGSGIGDDAVIRPSARGFAFLNELIGCFSS
ncbi:MAG: radical SAM family heme chaperone HemW [Gammaproteobacteria bacterium]|nr:radical SAM family heme chaperone HemW [Gammaproteobacteria bacterium]